MMALNTIMYCQSKFPLDLKKAIISGSSEQLAGYFSQNLELQVKNKEDVYTKAQAEHIMKDFFSKNIPEDFVVEMDEPGEEARYAIGLLHTQNGEYRVYLVYYELKKKYYISRISISNSN